MTTPLEGARRIVIKVGSSLLVDPITGAAHAERLRLLADDTARLHAQGKAIVIVTSGAVALGRLALGIKPGKLKLEEKQAAAAAGQPRLMRAWEDALEHHGLPVAQALVTFDNTEDRRRWLNARATLETLLDHGAIPVVNENDTVATAELRFGDNDRLAARVAQMISADALILLSDIDGLYDADPRSNKNAKHIPEVHQITAEMYEAAGEANAAAGVGSGGMATKVEAARIAMTAGCATAIALGTTTVTDGGPLRALAEGGRATWFIPDLNPETARRQWLAGTLNPAGEITIDAGAVKALSNGKSLLHAGVLAVSGEFQRGDAVSVVDEDGAMIARGMSAYASEDAAKLIGVKSSQIERILGFRGRPALIHRDDLVLALDA